jgi:hypothetical protein
MHCSYINTRLYHSKKHYQRIHVKEGKAIKNKRKYKAMHPLADSKDQQSKKSKESEGISIGVYV